MACCHAASDDVALGALLVAHGYQARPRRHTPEDLAATRQVGIVADHEPPLVPARYDVVLSLCSIHHRAFDEDLVGVSPDYEVRVHPRLLDEDDGPMLDVLKHAHRTSIVLPQRTRLRPDRELLAVRFERFQAA